jgi:hypothetical protein
MKQYIKRISLSLFILYSCSNTRLNVPFDAGTKRCLFVIGHIVKYSIDFKIECIQYVILSKHANESVKSDEIVHLVIDCS